MGEFFPSSISYVRRWDECFGELQTISTLWDYVNTIWERAAFHWFRSFYFVNNPSTAPPHQRMNFVLKCGQAHYNRYIDVSKKIIPFAIRPLHLQHTHFKGVSTLNRSSTHLSHACTNFRSAEPACLRVRVYVHWTGFSSPPISLNQVQPDQRTKMIICQQMEPSQRAVRIKQPKHINENVISAIASATK